MSTPHVIRLRAPWEAQVLPGGVTWTRRFGRPSGLDGRIRVWLCVAAPQAIARWRLNAQELADAASGRNDITDRLRERNQVELTFTTGAATATITPPFQVWLELIEPMTAEPVAQDLERRKPGPTSATLEHSDGGS